MYTTPTIRTRLALRAFAVALLAGCGGAAATMGDGGGGPSEPGPGEPQDVASVRLFVGFETQHIPLIAGDTTRVEVRLYTANGRRITSVTGGLELAFTFTPLPSRHQHRFRESPSCETSLRRRRPVAAGG